MRRKKLYCDLSISEIASNKSKLLVIPYPSKISSKLRKYKIGVWKTICYEWVEMNSQSSAYKIISGQYVLLLLVDDDIERFRMGVMYNSIPVESIYDVMLQVLSNVEMYNRTVGAVV